MSPVSGQGECPHLSDAGILTERGPGDRRMQRSIWSIVHRVLGNADRAPETLTDVICVSLLARPIHRIEVDGAV